MLRKRKVDKTIAFLILMVGLMIIPLGIYYTTNPILIGMIGIFILITGVILLSFDFITDLINNVLLLLKSPNKTYEKDLKVFILSGSILLLIFLLFFLYEILK